MRKFDKFEWGLGGLRGKGEWLAGELGFAEGAVVIAAALAPRIAAKGDAAQDSAVFFNT